ncbi:MAG: CocE/NonD family hydrolase [Bacteroidota bacterium]
MLAGQMVSTPFEFQFEQKTLHGLIEKSKDQPTKAIILLIPGYGQTNFVEGKWYYRLRHHLAAMGLTVVFWDKMGCGNSEGVFDAQQPVENSADEAFAAIKKIKQLKLPGSERIGCWGLSRAGWIVPLINERSPLDFWISVSGTDDKENFGYLVRSNLQAYGYPETEVQRLYNAWMESHRLLCTGASYEQYIEAFRPLTEDSTCQQLFGFRQITQPTEADRQQYISDRTAYTSKGHFDPVSGLWVYLKNFDQLLTKLHCPVLALFGANDTQVDWRKTKKLYEQTIGNNPKAKLSTKVFEQCNHNLQQCISCAYQEDLTALNWAACDGYYETIETWLRAQGM